MKPGAAASPTDVGREAEFSPITGEFRDRTTEARFRGHHLPEEVRQARFLFAIAIGVSVLFLAANLLLGKPDDHFTAIAARSAVIVASLLCYLAIVRVSPGYVMPLIVVWEVVVTLSAASLLSIQRDVASAAVLLVPAIFYLAVPTPFVVTIAMGVLSSGVMLAALLGTEGMATTDGRLATALLLANVLLAVIRSRNGRLLRTEWHAGMRHGEALAALAESRLLLERTFSAVPIPLIVSSIETGTVVRANEAAEKFLKVGPGELVGRHARDFYDQPGDRPAFTARLREDGLVREFHTHIRASDGDLRSVLLAARAIDSGAGDATHMVASVLDVTEQEERERQLRAAEAEYRALFENAVVGVYRSTPDGRMLRANPALVRLNGYDSEAELIAAVNDIATEWYVEPGRRDEWMRLMCEEGRVIDFVSEIRRHKTRERIWISENGWTVRGPDGAALYFEGTLIEITERMQAEARNQYLASYDSLTDLANRRLLMESLDKTSAWRRRHGGRFAVMCLDLDRFKAVNDAFGHAAGDLLLQEAARRLKSVCRAEDIVARTGGDEFTILSGGMDHPSAIAARALGIVEVFEAPFVLDGPRAVVGTSIGIAVAPDDGEDPSDLLKKADAALYRAKGEGRGAWRFHNDALAEAALRSAKPLGAARAGASRSAGSRASTGG